MSTTPELTDAIIRTFTERFEPILTRIEMLRQLADIWTCLGTLTPEEQTGLIQRMAAAATGGPMLTEADQALLTTTGPGGLKILDSVMQLRQARAWEEYRHGPADPRLHL